MAISYLGNFGTATGTTSSSGLASVAPTSTIVAGNLVVLTAAGVGATYPTGVNDPWNNIWRIDAVAVNTVRLVICSCVLANPLTPNDEVEVSIGGSVLYNASLAGFSGILAPLHRDVTATGTGSGTALSSGTTAATAQNVEVAVSAFAINASQAAFTPGALYATLGIVSQAGLGLVAEYKILAATGTQVAVGTAGTSGTWAGAIATYKGGTPRPQLFGQPSQLGR